MSLYTLGRSKFGTVFFLKSSMEICTYFSGPRDSRKLAQRNNQTSPQRCTSENTHINVVYNREKFSTPKKLNGRCVKKKKNFFIE